MSKSALIIDTPKNCAECRYCREMFNKRVCFIAMTTLPVIRCPFRPMPDSVPASSADDERYVKGFEAGWNMCLNEIGGNNE